MLSGAIPENEVLSTFASDGRLIIRFWCEMSEDEIMEELVRELTEIAIEVTLKKLGYLKKGRSARFKTVMMSCKLSHKYLEAKKIFGVQL